MTKFSQLFNCAFSGQITFDGGEKLAEKGQKINQTFLPLKDAIYTQSRWQIDGHENSSSYMPKNPPEVVFKPSFLVKMCPFFSIFLLISAFQQLQLTELKSCGKFEVARGFSHKFMGTWH